jgi:hypothetical protein
MQAMNCRWFRVPDLNLLDTGMKPRSAPGLRGSRRAPLSMAGETMHIDAVEHPVKLGSVPTETLGPRALIQADRIVGHLCPDPGEDQDWPYVGGPPIPIFEGSTGPAGRTGRPGAAADRPGLAPFSQFAPVVTSLCRGSWGMRRCSQASC